MDGNELLDRLYLDNDLRFNNEVKSITAIQIDAFISNWKGNLPAEQNLAQFEFVRQAILIGRFK